MKSNLNQIKSTNSNSITSSNNSTDNSMSTSNTSRYKNYLIEKLLNESMSPIQTNLKQSNTNDLLLMQQNGINTNNGSNGLNDSREDLTSETGTYVIEDHLDNHVLPLTNIRSNYDLDLKQSTNTIDLMSARAAIDETFGIAKLNGNDSSNKDAPNTPSSTPKRQTQKMIRARNQTYSLSKDLFIGDNSSNNTPNNEEESLNENKNGDDVPNSILKKTTTYDVIPNSMEEDKNSNEMNESIVSGVSGVSSKAIGTDVLLGDTERLMEQIKLKRFEKRQSLKARLISANNNLNQSRSSSSSCSSSMTMLSNSVNQEKKETDEPSHDTYKSKSWIIPCKEDDSALIQKENDDNYFNSTRATVNSSQDHSILDNQIKNQSRTNGGMAFEFILDDNNNNPVMSRSKIHHNNELNQSKQEDDDSSSLTNSLARSATGYASIRRLKSKTDENSSMLSSSSYSTLTATTNGQTTTPKSNVTNMSLGAKIQAKAKENGSTANANTSDSLDKNSKQRQSMRRISSDSSSLQLTNITASTNNAVSSPSQYMNRTLMLRQQTAKARRNSDNKLGSDHHDLSPPNSKTQMKSSLALNGVLKKSASNAATSSMTSIKNNNASNLTNKSYSNLNNAAMSSPSSNKKKSSRSNSREAVNTSHNSSLMTTSLTLPNGSNSLPGTHNDHRDSFLRRKTYDPVKAVELEKQKKKEEQIKRKSLLLQEQQQQQILKITEDIDINIDNSSYNKNPHYSIDENSVCDSFNSFPLQNLNSSITNKQSKPKSLNHSVSFEDQNNNNHHEDESSTYEKILQSTLQRLCIRLIQMSTGVLDKIGDNSSKSNESNSLLNSVGNTELERMQQLAKLVHSMQLVHDHVQIIDSTLFNPKPEEAYMKELTRIRQELASLNTSNLSYNNNQINN